MTTPGGSAPATFKSPRKRASLYVRLSVAADAENMSLEGMISDMRALCAREDLEEVALHVDDGKSGGRRDRNEFRAWLADARTGACDVLVNPVTDRLTREGLNVAATILDVVEGKDPDTGRITHKPVRLVDCNGLDSLHGDAFRFRFVIQAEVGRAERERIRDRTTRSARRLKRAGRWGGGAPPFGYKIVDNPVTVVKDGKEVPLGKVLAVNPEEAKHIRDAADALLGPTPDPLNRVVRRLNHAGVKPRRADQWGRTSVRRMMTSDALLGRVSENGRPLRGPDGQILTPFPPILTLAQLTALRAYLGSLGETPPPARGRPSRLLSGLLTCHSCGAAMTVHHRPRKHWKDKSLRDAPPFVQYRCPTTGKGKICEKSVTVSADAVDDFVEDLYLTTVGHMPYYRERTVVTGLEELADVEADIKEALSDLATKADAETFARLQGLQRRKEELDSVETESRTELVPTGLTMRQFWDRSMIDDRRSLLESAFEELVVFPGKRGNNRGFDPGRLHRRWREGPAAEDADVEYDDSELVPMHGAAGQG